MGWVSSEQINSKSFHCGYCGNKVASATGYYHDKKPHLKIYLCPHCDQPSFFFLETQVPGVAPGNEVKHLPEQVEHLYHEARNCTSISAYTAAVLACRKLLMNIAVAQGAEENKKFIDYVDYLAGHGYVPPNGRGWVDHIRRKGNEATHEIIVMNKSDAEDLISFSEMLLKFIYEFPNRVPQST
jgi:hypothetical protein